MNNDQQNKDEIKASETYNVRVKVNGFNLAKNAAVVWDCGGHPCYFRLEDFSPISPENGIKNTENAPKYDPFRRFRKGDRVSPCAWQDRAPTARMGACCIIPKPGTYEVLTDELHEMVSLRYGEDTIKMHICFLELVTPVEELEPYFISEGAGIIELYKGTTDEVVKAWFYDDVKAGVEALAAAEAECARLNAEWRKEQE